MTYNRVAVIISGIAALIVILTKKVPKTKNN